MSSTPTHDQMSTTPEEPCPDFREPWHPQAPPHPISLDKGVYWLNPKQFNRAVQCVNACAGMADPVAELAAMREAIKEAYGTLSELRGYPVERGYVDSPCLKEEDMLEVKTTLAKLQSFIK